MTRRLVTISAVILAALFALAALGYHSVRMWAAGLEGARLGQFARVAESIRSDVKRKLDDFLAAEQQRPYTHYQYYYVPDDFAQQPQAPVLRSPLSGTLSNEFAFGNFQIDAGGNVITPNDGLLAADPAAVDGELSRLVGLNRWNIENNLLPVLREEGVEDASRVEDISSAEGIADDKAVSRVEGVSPSVVKSDGPAVVAGKHAATAIEPPPVLKGKTGEAGRTQSLPIGSLTENLSTQVFRQSRAAAVSNTAQVAVDDYQQEVRALEPPQQVMIPLPAEPNDRPGVQVQLEQAAVAAADAIHEAQPPLTMSAVGQAAGPTTTESPGMAQPQAARPLPPPLTGTPVAGPQALSAQESPVRYGLADVQDGPGDAAGGRYGGVGADSGLSLGMGGYGGGAVRAGADMQQRVWAMDEAAPAQTDGRRAASPADTVEVRVEPFRPIVAPPANGKPSVFKGQVFLVRNVVIEDQRLIQGFQLDENKLIDEVRESAERITGLQSGMGFDLPQVSPVAGSAPAPADAEVAYTALLDFGFGYLAVNLLEMDPARIARQVTQIEHWYFAIIVTVLLVVTLALVALWRSAYAQLRLASRKDDFISAVSHELRTPLTSIRMYSEMLEKNWVKSPDKLGEYYRNMRQESERLSRLIENVLDFSRMQRGRKTYTFRAGDINRCVADVVEMMRPYAAQAGFTIETHLTELEPTAFDSDAVTQIVVNLLDNAVKYARDAADKRILVRTARTDGSVLIEVEDHGPGIPARHRKKVFEEFYRIGPEATRETAGTGLGLALVRRFAEAHRGFVEVLSARPTGAVLRVVLPVS